MKLPLLESLSVNSMDQTFEEEGLEMINNVRLQKLEQDPIEEDLYNPLDN